MEDLIIVTGGAGFIGSNFILQWIAAEPARILNLDKLTYAGNLNNLRAVEGHPRYRFEQGDIVDRDCLRNLLRREQPRAIVHFAAESHVDRSIHGPDDFVRTNVNGTFNLLEEARAYWSALPEPDRASFRFLHVSTDEVYGSLGPSDPAFQRPGLQRDHSLRAQQPVLRVQSGFRSSGPRLSPHLWPPRSDHQLFQ
jgi:dTDP-glucose 4,6-dehydratase